MMITAIFTKEKTTLTIETTETLVLEQFDSKDPVTPLVPGVNVVGVGAGVFKVLSKTALRVSGGIANVYVASTTNTKDDDFPDPPRLSITPTQLHAFMVDGRSTNDPALR